MNSPVEEIAEEIAEEIEDMQGQAFLFSTMEKAQQENVKETKRKIDSILLNSIDHGEIHQGVMEYVNELKKKRMIVNKVNETRENLYQKKKAAGLTERISDDEDYFGNTNQNDDEIPMQIISTKDDNQDEEKLIEDAVSSLRAAQYRLSEGEGEDEYWTMKYSDKDNLQPLMDQANDKQSMFFRAGVGIADSYENETIPTGAYASDMAKQDEATIRVTNLSEETEGEDLCDYFTAIGIVNRIVLFEDKTNSTSKGSAFITFADKKDAQKAVEFMSGFPYNHRILKVEWANERQNQ